MSERAVGSVSGQKGIAKRCGGSTLSPATRELSLRESRTGSGGSKPPPYRKSEAPCKREGKPLPYRESENFCRTNGRTLFAPTEKARIFAPKQKILPIHQTHLGGHMPTRWRTFDIIPFEAHMRGARAQRTSEPNTAPLCGAGSKGLALGALLGHFLGRAKKWHQAPSERAVGSVSGQKGNAEHAKIPPKNNAKPFAHIYCLGR